MGVSALTTKHDMGTTEEGKREEMLPMGFVVYFSPAIFHSASRLILFYLF